MITAQVANELTRKKNNMRQLRWIERAIKSAARSGDYNLVGMGTLAPCIISRLEQLGYCVEITDTRSSDLIHGYAMYEIRWDDKKNTTEDENDSRTNIDKYFWECPKCHEKVDALKQLVNTCFDENGEAEFAVAEGQGLCFHTIYCPKCHSRWTMSISGIERAEE